MRVEIAVALKFLTSHLYSKLPRRRVNMLAEEITQQLRSKYQNHWHYDRPSRGSGYRCLKFNLPKIDRILCNAAKEVGLDEKEIVECLPNDLIIWIDPGEVSYRIGERGSVIILYNKDYPCLCSEEFGLDSTNNKVKYSSDNDSGCYSSISQLYNYSPNSTNNLSKSESDNPDLKYSPSPEMSSLLSYGKTTPIISSGYESSTSSYRSSPLFTTASFAQTKFGSTKLKNSSRKNGRMLPNEFSAYIKRKSQVQHASSIQQRNKVNDLTLNQFPYQPGYFQSRSHGPLWQTMQNDERKSPEESNQNIMAYKHKVKPYLRCCNYSDPISAYESYPSSSNSFYDQCLIRNMEKSQDIQPSHSFFKYNCIPKLDDYDKSFNGYKTHEYYNDPTYNMQVIPVDANKGMPTMYPVFNNATQPYQQKFHAHMFPNEISRRHTLHSNNIPLIPASMSLSSKHTSCLLPPENIPNKYGLFGAVPGAPSVLQNETNFHLVCNKPTVEMLPTLNTKVKYINHKCLPML